MKRKVVQALIGLSMISILGTGVCVSAEEYYYEDGTYGDEYVDYDYSEEYYYDDGTYYGESYDDTYYYDDTYDSGYSDAQSYYEESYDDGSYYEESYDDGSYDDGAYYEESYDDGSSEESYAEESYTEETSAPEASSVDLNVSSDVSGDDSSWVQTPLTDIGRGDNSAREEANAEGMVHSYLSGQLVDKSVAYSRPIAIMINNIIDALPQDGISKADVIYEAPVEGEITRMMAIFDDVSGIDKIGPVRSCRDYYLHFAMEFDAIYVHFGQAVYAYDLLNSQMINNISGLEYQDQVGRIDGYAGEDIFFRTDDRPSPHNCYTSATGIKTAIERKEYSTELDNSYTGHFKFAADGETVTYTDGTATHIVPHQYSNNAYFEYNADCGEYFRYEYPDRSAGAAQIDQTTGTQLSYDNVIIQYCAIQPYDDHGYLNINTNSGGEAILFTRGTYQKATWVKSTSWGPARYYDAEGNEIKINQGKTWVCIVQDTRKSDTSFQ